MNILDDFYPLKTFFSDRKGTPKIIQLLRQAQGLAPNPEEESALKKLTPHVPGIVTFANHSRVLPWTTSYTTVLMFADISGNLHCNFFQHVVAARRKFSFQVCKATHV